MKYYYNMLFLKKLFNLFIPEDKKIEKLLNLSQSELRKILPRAETVKDLLTFPIFNYRNKNVSAIIWAVKYRFHPELIKRLSEFLYEEIMEIAEDRLLFEGKSEIALIPIPMSNKTRRERGFNQTEELCSVVSKISNGEIKVLNILEKIKDTAHQTKLSREERLQNMKNTMKAKIGNYKIGNYLFIIIDDVYTTGATISEARRALREAGVKRALAVSLAH